MKFIKEFSLFESVHDNTPTYNDLMGKLLHLYGSIPVPKEKSSVVIKKIITTSMGKTFKLGENVDINFCKVHDKIRFSDYFNNGGAKYYTVANTKDNKFIIEKDSLYYLSK